MGTLRTATSGSHIETEHDHLLERLLRRGEELSERRPDEVLKGDYSEKAVELARRNWRKRMVHEHDSAAVFTNLVPQMMAAEAPLDFKTVVTRCGLDELRHAGLCGQVVEFLGGEAEAEADLETRALPEHPDVDRFQAALRNVVFASCLSETVSMALLTAEREHVEEPFIDRVLKQLAGDESLHARLGWVYLAECIEAEPERSREALVDYLPVAFRGFENEMLGAMPLGNAPDELLEEARKLGFSESARARPILFDTIHEAILPRLQEFGLSAADAWDERNEL
ncbi:MAG: ferritin-like domain-containing protein [Bradymonadaceae bacterium]